MTLVIFCLHICLHMHNKCLNNSKMLKKGDHTQITTYLHFSVLRTGCFVVFRVSKMKKENKIHT